MSHLLERLRSPQRVYGDWKFSITQPASSVRPSILSPVEGAGLGARRPPSIVSCGHQFSSLPLAKPSCIELPGPFFRTDGCFRMDGPPLHPSSSAPIARPHPAGPDLEAGSPEHPPGAGSGMQCLVPGAAASPQAMPPSHGPPPSAGDALARPADPGCSCVPSARPAGSHLIAENTEARRVRQASRK